MKGKCMWIGGAGTVSSVEGLRDGDMGGLGEF